MLLDIAAITSIATGLLCLLLFALYVFKNNWQIYACISLFWISALTFHVATVAAFVTPLEILAGPVVLAFLLFGIRFAAQLRKIAHPLDIDSCLFLCGAGLWLGVTGGLTALILGSAVGLIYFALMLWKDRSSIVQTGRKLINIPTAQSFATGVFIAGLWEFRSAIDFL